MQNGAGPKPRSWNLHPAKLTHLALLISVIVAAVCLSRDASGKSVSVDDRVVLGFGFRAVVPVLLGWVPHSWICGCAVPRWRNIK